MNKLRSIVGGLVGAVALVALSVAGSAQVAASGATGVTVTDARPADERSTETLSLWITSCEYAIRRVGDDATQPSRVALLEQDLRAALGEKFANSVFTLKRYTIYFNFSAVLRRSNPAAGRLGEVIFYPHDCSRANTRGYYSTNEVTNINSPIIVEIDGVLDGQSYSVRVVHSPNDELVPRWDRPDSSSELAAAIRKAHDGLVQQINGSSAPQEGTSSVSTTAFRRFDDFVKDGSKTGERN